MKTVYFDNAATTALRPEVIEVMQKALEQTFGNPSSTHAFGRSAKTQIEQARKNIAAYIGAQASEIVFTSGGTEADNMVLKSAVQDLGVKHIITSKIEHHAVLHTVEYLKEKYDTKLSFVSLGPKGEIDIHHLEKLLEQTKDKTLVSLMYINNEIGNKLAFHQIALLCQKYRALFHSDTVQAIGHYMINTTETPVDFMAAAAHKFHGPKGVGFAYIRKESGLQPMIHGGGQERGNRAGTESVHNILGMEKALSAAYDNLQKEAEYVDNIQSYFLAQLQQKVPQAACNGFSGDKENSTYTLLNVRLPITAEQATLLLFQMDLKGIACSKGSACQSGSDRGSHVLKQILDKEAYIQPSIRFSFSIYNTQKEVDYVIEVLQSFFE
ncbi:MAG: cysteine desulfurase [Flavobacteriaceae bacterium]|nr:cysteine desulfurase [Flavobacteriaceae bacterium]